MYSSGSEDRVLGKGVRWLAKNVLTGKKNGCTLLGMERIYQLNSPLPHGEILGVVFKTREAAEEYVKRSRERWEVVSVPLVSSFVDAQVELERLEME
jgi:hypothetical protein